MRVLEPRLLLDAAGGEDATTAIVAAVHGSLAEAYFEAESGQQDSENFAWNKVVQTVEQIPPYIPEYARNPQEDPVEIAFIASDIEDAELLTAALPDHVEIVYLDANSSGLAQMADVLMDRSNVDAIHIISHGQAGALSLGETDLTAETMVSTYASQMETIGQSLAAHGDILIYGCDFASGELGQEAIDTLAHLTGADIAASDDKTGHSDLGGDWQLERQSGTIEAVAFSAGSNWFGTLAPQTLVAHEGDLNDIDRDEQIASDRNIGQTFSYDSGTPTYEVDQIDLVLQVRDDGDPAENITVSIRETFTGAEIASGTISSALLSENYEWYSFMLDSPATLNSNQTYYIVATTDGSPPRNVEVGVERDGTYADGDQIRPDGTVRNDADVLFRVINSSMNADPTITSNGGGAFASVDMDENQTLATTVVATDPDLPSDTLTYSIIGGLDQAQFTIDPVSGELRFLTPPDFENPTDNFPTNGIYSVSVQVTDSQGATDTQTISVVVRNVNEAPVAAADTFTVVEDGAVSVDVLANDSDPEGDPLTITEVDGQLVTDGGPAVSVANGTVQLLAGELVFRPTANYNGPGSFTYRVSDGNGEISSGTVSGTVTAVNDPPVASANTYTTNEDTPVSGNAITDDTGTGIDNDPDGDALALNVSSVGTFATAQGGSIVLAANGDFTYTPPADFGGTDSFTYTVTDGTLTAAAALTFTVTPVNDTPSANADTFTVSEDGSVSIDVLANDTDVDGDTLSITRVDGQPVTDGGPAVIVANGTVQLVAGELVFTPTLNYAGPASFTYTVSDGNGETATATVSGSVGGTNDAPDAVGDTFGVIEDGSVIIPVLANDSDIDGDPLMVTQVDGQPIIDGGAAVAVSNGTVRLVAGELLFSPATNYSGPIIFVYTISDGNGGFDTAQVTGTVTPINDAPSGTDTTVTIAEDGVLVFDATNFGFTDPADTPPDTFAAVIIETLPFRGTLTFNGLAVTAGQTINVASLADLRFTPEPDGNNDTTPGTAYASFGFRIMDDDGTVGGGEDTDPTVNVITIAVTPANDAPIAIDNSYATNEDTPVGGNAITDDTGLGADSDIDGDALTLDPASVGTFATARGGTITLASDGSFTYAPRPNFNGTDTFGYTITDGALTDTATLIFIVIPVNDPPIATGETVNTVEDTSYTFSVADFTFADQEGDALQSATLSDLMLAGGSLTHSGGVAVTNGMTLTGAELATLIFTPAPNSSATATFDYAVNDADPGIIRASMTILVAPANDPPVAVDNNYATNEDTPVSGNVIVDDTGLGTDGDIDGDALSLDAGSVGTFVTTQGGTITLAANGAFTYSPPANFNGTDSFDYTVSDGSTTDGATLTFNVAAINDDPVASADSFNVSEDSSVSIDALINDSDPDGDALTITKVDSQPIADGGPSVAVANGTVQLIAGELIFTPTGNYSGPANFTYEISDGNGAVATGTVSGAVTATNDAPVAANNSYTTAEDTIATGNAIADNTGTGADSDPDGDPLFVTSNSIGTFATPQGGTITLVANGDFTYIPAANFNGTDIFVYSITDGFLTDTAMLTFNVTSLNDAPVAADNFYVLSSGAQTSGNVLSDSSSDGRDSDPDGDGLALDGGSVGTFATDQGGTITLTGNGEFTYIPPTDFTGIDTFSYSVTDGALADTASVTFDVTDGSAPLVPPTIIPDTDPPENPDSEEPTEEEDIPLLDSEVVVSPGETSTTTPVPAQAPKIVLPQQDEQPPTFVSLEPAPIEEVPAETSVPPIETAPPPQINTQITDYSFEPVNYDVFEDDLNRTGEDIRKYDELLGTTTAKVTFTFGAILGVGSVSWLLQSGILAATLLSTLPAWKRFDPIAIVSGRRDENEDDDASDVEIMMQKIRDAGARVSREQVL